MILWSKETVHPLRPLHGRLPRARPSSSAVHRKRTRHRADGGPTPIRRSSVFSVYHGIDQRTDIAYACVGLRDLHAWSAPTSAIMPDAQR
ncbi:MAG: hypothetical protein MZW92_06400 [Comamonadaceae bacterium]|nr:hypothetical protein [Comamonadaceae bacterium]